MFHLTPFDLEDARRIQMQASREAERRQARAELERRDIERWQYLFAANNARSGGSA